MLNMSDRVHPWHWDVAEFQPFDIPPEKEFDLIAPVAIFFMADLREKDQAVKAWNKLRKLKHPLAADMTASEMTKETSTPDGLHERYKALFMFLAKRSWPGAEFGQDQWGALYVSNTDCVVKDQISGCASGTFPWFLSTKALANRLALEID